MTDPDVVLAVSRMEKAVRIRIQRIAEQRTSVTSPLPEVEKNPPERGGLKRDEGSIDQSSIDAVSGVSLDTGGSGASGSARGSLATWIWRQFFSQGGRGS